jgi:hypothetical protein
MRTGKVRFVGGIYHGKIETRSHVGYSAIHVPIPRKMDTSYFNDIDQAYSAFIEYDTYYYQYVDAKGYYVYSVWKSPPKLLALEILISRKYYRGLRHGAINHIGDQIVEFTKAHGLTTVMYDTPDGIVYSFRKKEFKGKVIPYEC